jgi:hypothetical protein
VTIRSSLAAAIAASTLGLSGVAGAAPVTYIIQNGEAGQNEHSCTRIVQVFTSQDCTYGRTIFINILPGSLSPVWSGPTRQGGYYEPGSAQDTLTYDPNDANPATAPEPRDPDTTKITARVVGTVTIDDNDTPANGGDDTVLLNFSVQGTTPSSGLVRLVSTGQTTRALQRWTTFDHSMAAPYTVDAAVPNANGGFDYIIGSRGTPTKLCRATNPGVNENAAIDDTDCFPSNNYSKDSAQPTAPAWWGPIPASGSVGIERSVRLTDKPGPGNANVQGTPVPNVGITTTASFTGASCETNNGAQDDCTLSPLIVGSSLEDPGYDNMVGIISTGTAGITSAEFYWTQEYHIGAFGAAPPSQGDNSFQAGLISFTGVPQTANAVDDAASVVQNSSNNVIDVLANDIEFPAVDTTVTIASAPTNGTATISPNKTVSYTPGAGFTGVATFTYTASRVVEGSPVSDTATVTVTVAPDVDPVGAPLAITINTQGQVGAAATVAVPPGNLGNTPATVTVSGNAACAVIGTQAAPVIRYTPAANFLEGGDSDTCNYTITDQNGDVANGVVTATITDVSPTLNDGTGEGDADGATANTTFVPGNGPVSAHTLAVTTDGGNGSCSATATSNSNVRVTYTPDDGFSGDDSCVVTLSDADGDSETGTFTFAIESSAISLPGGGGAIDLWSLALLGGLPLLRRRRR